MEKKIIGALVGIAIGAIAEDALMTLGMPKHLAKIADGIIGSALA